MIYAFNILILLLAGLIMYWWANQGAFSALLHLICVIIAGAVALALWEPVTIGFLLRGSGFDNYAWGTSLVGMFVALLFIFRFASDKLVPNNVHLPRWANFAVGIPVGAAAGLLTMGIFVIAAGHIQTTHDMFGFRGWQRSERTGKVTKITNASLWLPIDQLTGEFYGLLSVSSMKSGSPLRHYAPDMYKNDTLLRDSYFERARGSVSIVPSGVQVRNAYYCADRSEYAVRVNFNAKARDFGSQLTLSSSQVRLIGNGRGLSRAPYSFPEQWTQESRDGFDDYLFDDVTAYITGVPGREATEIILHFPAPEGDRGDARFIQLKGTRFDLPRIESVAGEEWRSVVGGVSTSDMASTVDPSSLVGGDISSAIRVDNGLRMINAGSNNMPSGFKERDKFLTSGDGRFPSGGERPPRALQLKGIFEEQGTRIVKLNISRNSPANIFGAARSQVPEGARLALVDATGHTYSPIGYIYQSSLGIDIKLVPTSYVRTIDEMPSLPRAGTQTMTLLFRVTEGATIVAFRWGDYTVGTCNLAVLPA